MRMPTAALLAATMLVAAPAAQPRDATSLERPFAAGGRITMDLAAGEYEITGSPDDRIRITWQVDDDARPDDVRVAVDVRGGEAAITTYRRHDSNFSVRM